MKALWLGCQCAVSSYRELAPWGQWKQHSQDIDVIIYLITVKPCAIINPHAGGG